MEVMQTPGGKWAVTNANGETLTYAKPMPRHGGHMTGLRTSHKAPGKRQVIVTGGQEPQDTPEHNRLQARFLDDEFCKRFVMLCGFERDDGSESEVSYPSSTPYGYSRKAKIPSRAKGPIEFGRCFEDGRAQIDLVLDASYRVSVTAEKEDGEIFQGETSGCYRKYIIEIKPTIGDDYPAVLRQAKAKRCNVVAFETFTATTVTFDQVKAMFAPIRLVCIAAE